LPLAHLWVQLAEAGSHKGAVRVAYHTHAAVAVPCQQRSNRVGCLIHAASFPAQPQRHMGHLQEGRSREGGAKRKAWCRVGEGVLESWLFQGGKCA
jgi:hypothetical protein